MAIEIIYKNTRGKCTFLSEYANAELCQYLNDKGYTLEKVSPAPNIDGGVASHPDIHMCKLGAEPSAPIMLHREALLGREYRQHVGMNAVIMGHNFIHNLSLTAPALLDYAKKSGLKLIDVKQGYTKCSMVVIDRIHAITSDEGIARKLSAEAPEIELLSVQPRYVSLPGFPYGFIGGASGRVDGEVLFNGDLSKHPDFFRIKEFVESCGLGIRFFDSFPLTDIGSVIGIS